MIVVRDWAKDSDLYQERPEVFGCVFNSNTFPYADHEGCTFSCPNLHLITGSFYAFQDLHFRFRVLPVSLSLSRHCLLSLASLSYKDYITKGVLLGLSHTAERQAAHMHPPLSELQHGRAESLRGGGLHDTTDSP